MTRSEPTSDPRPGSPERFRTYLEVIARGAIPIDMQARLGESDVVSDVLLKALSDAERFAGWNDQQCKAYLRKMLTNVVIDTMRGMRRQARDPKRERSLQDSVDATGVGLDRFLEAQMTRASTRMGRAETRRRLLAEIARLPAEQFYIVEQRRLRGRSVREIAAELGKSEPAIRKLEARALLSLRSLVGRKDADP